MGCCSSHEAPINSTGNSLLKELVKVKINDISTKSQFIPIREGNLE